MMSQLNLQAELYRVILQRRMLHRKYFYIFNRIKDRLDMSSERKLYSLVVTETTNKGRDYLRKSYVKREVMFDNEVSELQYKSVESAEAALLGMEKAQYITMAFENPPSEESSEL